MDGTAPLLLDLADAELASARLEGGTLVLHFAALRVKPAASAQRGEGARHLGGVVLMLADAQVPAPLAGCIGRVADAELLIGGRRQAALPVPLASPGPVRLVLQFANGSSLAAHGHGLTAQATPGATVTEHYHC